jgi:hypothetical protein
MAVSPRANLLARTPFPDRSSDRKLPATRRVALQGDPARLDTGPSKRRGSVRRPHGLTKRSATPQGGGGRADALAGRRVLALPMSVASSPLAAASFLFLRLKRAISSRRREAASLGRVVCEGRQGGGSG